MSKSSSTNYPNGFLTKSLSHLLIVSSLTECDGSAARIAASHEFRQMKRQVLLGGYSSEVPPLPIPNREVKLTYADGTAFYGGRVGSRLFKPNPIRVRLFLCLCVRAGDVGIRWIVDLGCSPTVGKEMQVLLGQQLAGTARMNDERTVGLCPGGPQLTLRLHASSAGCCPYDLQSRIVTMFYAVRRRRSECDSSPPQWGGGELRGSKSRNIPTRQPHPRQKRFREKGGRGDGA